MNQIETRALVRALSAGPKRTISGYAVVYNSPSLPLGNPPFVEVISPTAWTPQSDSGDVLCTFNHDTDNYLGRSSAGTLRLSTDSTGLHFECDIPDTAAGHDLYTLVQRGDVTGCSFTFFADADEWSTSADGTPLRTVTRMRVKELGPVLNPAYAETSISARSLARAAAAIPAPTTLKETNMTDNILSNGNGTDVRGISSGTHAKRSQADVKIFGRAYTELRESGFVDAVDARPVPVVLNASGRGSRLIERVTTYPFDKHFGIVPVTPKITADIQPRNVAQAAQAARMNTIGAVALKVSAVVSVDNDTLVDVPSTEAGINTALAAAVGARTDDVLINGGDDGDNVATGILAQGIRTAALTAIGYDEIADAIARIETSGGIADAVIGSPVAIASLRKAIPGDKIGTLPDFISLAPLADGTAILLADTVLVADLNSCGIGVRSALEVTKTDTEPEAFQLDSAFIAGRARVGSVVLADAARAQVLTTQAA